MSKKNKKIKEGNSLINNTSVVNKQSINNDDKKCCSATTPQANPKYPENTSEQQESRSLHNISAKNTKSDISAPEKDSNPISDTSPSTDNMNSDEKKCSSSSDPQVESKVQENTNEQQESISIQNSPPKNTKSDNSAPEEDCNPAPNPSPSPNSLNPGNALQQQNAHLVKKFFLQIWRFLDGLIKVFTFCILAYTLLITKKQVGIMQDQINEMQIDRNESYKPFLTANPVQENTLIRTYAIPESGRTVYKHWLSYFEKLDNMEDYPFIETSLSEKQTFTQFMFANIGTGIATRVKFSWDNENADRLYQTLLKYDKDASEYLKKMGDVYYFNPDSFNSRHIEDSMFKTTYESIEYSYMLANREETYSVELPILYSVLFSEIIRHKSSSDVQERPAVNLKVEFSDTQGIEYYETMTLTASDSSYSPINGTKDGHVSYTIRVTNSNPFRK